MISILIKFEKIIRLLFLILIRYELFILINILISVQYFSTEKNKPMDRK